MSGLSVIYQDITNCRSGEWIIVVIIGNLIDHKINIAGISLQSRLPKHCHFEARTRAEAICHSDGLLRRCCSSQ